MLLFLALEPEHLVLRLPKLVPGGGELELHLVVLALGLLKVCLQNEPLLPQILFLERQLFQFVRPGQDAGVLIDGAAGHGTAGVHDLAVQGDNLKPAPVLLGHGDGSVHVLDDDGPPQEIVHNSPVALLAGDKPRGDAHKAPAVLQAVFLKAPALNGGQGQEGGPAAAGAF